MKHRPQFDELLDELENEYGAMVEILSGHGVDEIVDCAKLSNNGESPITYGDVEIDELGNMRALETVLTDAEDTKTLQSLDYIFQFKRKA